MSLFRVLPLLVLGFTPPLFADPPVSETDIKLLIEKLGDESYEERASASQRLFDLGEQALPLLRKYENDQDSERRYRVGELLKDPEQVIDAWGFVWRVRARLAHAPEQKDLFLLQSEVQRAYDISRLQLEPLRDQIASALTGARNLEPRKREKSQALIKEYLAVLQEQLRGSVLEDTALILKLDRRPYRLTCFDHSLGSETYELLALDGSNEKTSLGVFLSTSARLSNGRPVTTRWSNGKAFDPEESLSLRAHIAFNPQTGERYGEYVRYIVNDGLTLTGDGIDVANHLGLKFFQDQEISAAALRVRQLDNRARLNGR